MNNADTRSSVAGAAALESRLYAPCCYNGTLDIHASELAQTLRTEIEVRLAQGETATVIQDDFVGRYGDKVLAARSDTPSAVLGLAIALIMALAALTLGIVMRKLTKHDRLSSTQAIANTEADAFDQRLDQELRDMEG
jgi:cytochrome c-type biogenesis protein CcmH